MAIPKWVWITGAVLVGLTAIILSAAAIQASVYASQDKEAKVRLGVPLAVPLATLKQHPALYDVLARTLSVLRDAGVDAWACAGTALGIERHGDVIPWDDDADLCVWEADRDTIESAPWAAHGLSVRTNPLGYQVYATGKPSGASVDLFPVRQIADGSIEYSEPFARIMWPTERFTSRDEVYPLASRAFGPMHVPTAAGNVDYVKRAFSAGALTQARFQPPHLLPLWERALIVLNPWIPKAWDMPKPASL